MTKKHFIALADAVKSRPLDFPNPSALADVLEGLCPKFNRNRWLGYVAGANGPNGGQIK